VVQPRRAAVEAPLALLPEGEDQPPPVAEEGVAAGRLVGAAHRLQAEDLRVEGARPVEIRDVDSDVARVHGVSL
jgi:hypothetical protein